MNIREKTVGVILVSLVLLLAGGYAATRSVLLSGFEEVERESAFRDMERARRALAQSLAAMERTAGDWGDWDETVRFIGGDRTYILRNLQDATFENLDLNLMMFLDPRGKMVFARWYDLERKVEAAPPEAAQDRMVSAEPWRDELEGKVSFSGVTALPDLPPLLTVFRAIRSSEARGPPRGWLAMGRFLDAAEARALRENTRLELDFAALEEASLPPDFLRAREDLADGKPSFLSRGEDGSLSVFSSLADPAGRASLLVRVRASPDFSVSGRKTLLYVLAVLGITGLVFALLTLFFLEHLVLARVFTLARGVGRIASSRDTTLRVGVEGDDEISGLARGINRMLEKVEGSQRELRRSEERLSVTLGSIGEGVVTVGLGGEVLLLNRAAEAMTGWKDGEAAGKPLAAVFALRLAGNGEPVELDAEAVLRRRQVSSIPPDCRLAARKGEEHDVSGSLAPVRGASGEVTGAVLVFRDLTEHRQFEAELLKAQKLESVALLAGGIAHDFNNLLTGILGNLSLARTVLKGEEKAARFLEEAERAGFRARALASQLLTFARSGAPIKRILPLAPLVREAVQFATQGSRAVAVFSLPPDLWPVEVDEGQMGQVFHNLAVNSAQAMPEGGVITITAANAALDAFNSQALPPGDYVRLYFEDEGTGIPPELLPRIFDPYFTTREKGSGLGLAIVYSILLRHHGRVSVHSTPGKGAVFTLYMPARPGAAAGEEKEKAAGPLGAGRRVLLVDRDEMIRNVGKEMLSELGFRAAAASEGVEAVSLLRAARGENDRFSAIIFDIAAPGSGGRGEVLARILEGAAGAPVILSSGDARGEAVDRAREMGFAAVLAKPFNLLELRSCLERILLPFSPREAK